MMGNHLSIGGLDVVLAGHSAQAKPIGDEPLYKMGSYIGKGLNTSRNGAADAAAPSCTSFVERGCLLRNEFEDVALLRSVWRIDDGNDRMTPAERLAYRSEADKFLSVTSRMAELEWTPHDHSCWQSATEMHSWRQRKDEGRSSNSMTLHC